VKGVCGLAVSALHQAVSFTFCAALFTAAVLLLGTAGQQQQEQQAASGVYNAGEVAAVKAAYMAAVVVKAKLWSPRFIATNAAVLLAHRAVEQE